MKRTLLVASISLLLVASIPGIAHAHPAYKASNPAWDASVSSPPSEVWVEFTERIEGGSVTIYDACGERVDHGEDAMNLTKDRLTTGMHGDRAGEYVVEWSVLGADGHETRGEFTFSSSGGSACPGTSEPEPDPEPDPRREREIERPRTEDERIETDDNDATTTGSSRREDTSRSKQTAVERDRAETRNERRTIDTAQAPEEMTRQTETKSIWDGIPIGDFLMSLAVAALIGAAGGRIYAGIIGPRR